MSSAGESLLAINGVRVCYGAVEALNGIDVHVRRGEIVTLIGANGAGKTSLLMTICGQPPASAGEIHFDGESITGLPTHVIVRRGIAHAPEARRIFARMTVRENLRLGAAAAPAGDFSADLERVLGFFPLLAERIDQRGGTLSGGEQQMLAIGRALMGRPKLLLLDEPSLGLAPLVVKHIFRIIRDLNERHGTTIFLVEQNAHHALRLAHRGYVLANGRVVLSGTGAELLANPDVRAAYLEGAG